MALINAADIHRFDKHDIKIKLRERCLCLEGLRTGFGPALWEWQSWSDLDHEAYTLWCQLGYFEATFKEACKSLSANHERESRISNFAGGAYLSLNSGISGWKVELAFPITIDGVTSASVAGGHGSHLEPPGADFVYGRRTKTGHAPACKLVIWINWLSRLLFECLGCTLALKYFKEKMWKFVDYTRGFG